MQTIKTSSNRRRRKRNREGDKKKDLQTADSDVTVTPYPAGHLIGGALWKISKETDEIVYAVDYNHKKEMHLDSSGLASQTPAIGKSPSLLITDCKNALARLQHRNYKRRDEAMFREIKGTLRKGGDVLLPVDSAGRALELLFKLDTYWTVHSELSGYGLCFLCREGNAVLEQAQ